MFSGKAQGKVPCCTNSTKLYFTYLGSTSPVTESKVPPRGSFGASPKRPLGGGPLAGIGPRCMGALGSGIGTIKKAKKRAMKVLGNLEANRSSLLLGVRGVDFMHTFHSKINTLWEETTIWPRHRSQPCNCSARAHFLWDTIAACSGLEKCNGNYK